jgi:hypothetical protein
MSRSESFIGHRDAILFRRFSLEGVLQSHAWLQKPYASELALEWVPSEMSLNKSRRRLNSILPFGSARTQLMAPKGQ